MDDRARTAWLLRRAGLGAAPGELDRPPAAVLDRLTDPAGHGIGPAADPWDDAVLAAPPSRELRLHAIDGWLERMRVTPRPLEERMAWIWHDHFATSLAKVNHPGLMVAQIRTIQRHALGSFPALVRAMTVDAAMLLWLDGATSTRGRPNENYGRELLELFTVGLGAHTEADVMAAARALTGWTVQRGTGKVVFVRRRHDDAAQLLLGRRVRDVDGVVTAACGARACAPFVTAALARHLLGPAAAADTELVQDLAADFRRGGLELRPLVRALLLAGMSRADTAVVEAPVPWLVRAERQTGARLPAQLRVAGLVAAGQVPMAPPDVGGWPGHETWLSAGTVVTRASMAAALAAAAPPSGAARAAARRRDLRALSVVLGRPGGFAAATGSAVRAASDDISALAVALAAPDQVVV